MYFPYFATYMLVGLAAGIGVFYWALKNGQFRDQERARYLPLEIEPEPALPAPTRFNRWEVWALVFLASGGLAATAAVLGYAVLFAPAAG